MADFNGPIHSNYGKELLSSDETVEVRHYMWGEDVPFDFSTLLDPDPISGAVQPVALAPHPTVDASGFPPLEPRPQFIENWSGFCWGYAPHSALNGLKGKVALLLVQENEASHHVRYRPRPVRRRRRGNGWLVRRAALLRRPDALRHRIT
jgi:hypothetical protein